MYGFAVIAGIGAGMILAELAQIFSSNSKLMMANNQNDRKLGKHAQLIFNHGHWYDLNSTVRCYHDFSSSSIIQFRQLLWNSFMCCRFLFSYACNLSCFRTEYIRRRNIRSNYI